MKSNIELQLKWLCENLQSSQNTGFKYAGTASNDSIRPSTFNFDNQQRKISRNCSLASLSSLGVLELETLRKDDSPIRQHDNQTRPHFSLQQCSPRSALQINPSENIGNYSNGVPHSNPQSSRNIHNADVSHALEDEDAAFLAFDVDGM